MTKLFSRLIAVIDLTVGLHSANQSIEGQNFKVLILELMINYELIQIVQQKMQFI